MDNRGLWDYLLTLDMGLVEMELARVLAVRKKAANIKRLDIGFRLIDAAQINNGKK
jgi:hypothetical protein